MDDSLTGEQWKIIKNDLRWSKQIGVNSMFLSTWQVAGMLAEVDRLRAALAAAQPEPPRSDNCLTGPIVGLECLKILNIAANSGLKDVEPRELVELFVAAAQPAPCLADSGPSAED